MKKNFVDMPMKRLRQVLATVCFTFVTLLFLDFTGTIHHWFGWLARVQFLPALLAFNAGVIAFLIVLTLVFGRVYCSVICPLGVFQDIAARFGRRRKKLPYTFSRPKNVLRYGVLAAFVIIAVAFHAAAWLDPYAIYGRAANSLVQPLWMWGNNLLAYFAERMDSYAFYPVEVWMKSLAVFCVSFVMIAAVALLAWRNGRTYCNTVCPVGTVLGFFSRYSLFRITIDTSKCNGCTLCARNCKASCIDAKSHQVDGSRCVACFNCLDKCTRGAIGYRFAYGKKAVGDAAASGEAGKEKMAAGGRRSFLAGAAVMLASAASAQVAKKVEPIKMDGGLADIVDKKEPVRSTPITPPGSQSARNMQANCTACQLCVSVCPNEVLRPSHKLETFMQPYMSYERGYCRPECTECADVCPAGAILKISRADKSSIQIGHAVWVKDRCIPLTDGQECGNCARHCPTGAILMVPSVPGDPKSLKIPAVNTERCIGCGACENLCPARPLSAIYVEGHEVHRTI